MTPPSPESQAAVRGVVLLDLTEGFHAERQEDYRDAERKIALLLDSFAASRVRAAVERVLELCANCEAISDAKMTKSEIIAMTIRREFADILRSAPEPRNE